MFIKNLLSAFFLWLLIFFFGELTFGADWPTYRGDNNRSGISQESPALPLRCVWIHKAMHQPSAAWPQMPAKQDYWHNVAALSPTNTYDRAYHITVADNRLYYGSSADDTIYCVDVRTGKTLWSFVTEGPVRLAPSVVGEKVYAASDDGCVYCLRVKDGGLIWRYRGAADRRFSGNGRMISRWPVRCGVVVEGGVVYFSCGIFPKEGVYLCAVNAETGKEIWKKKINVSAQGYLLASPTRLFVPTGRTSPAAFDRSNGNELGGFGGRGGSFALVLEDMLVHGPGEKGNIYIDEPTTREKMISTPGRRLIAKGQMVYILREKTLCAIERNRYIELSRQLNAIEKIKKSKRSEEQNSRIVELREQRKACLKWEVACSAPYSLIMASETLFAGGENQVLAYRAADGVCLWKGNVTGKAYGLAVSDGRLFVSTDEGTIHCFEAGDRRTKPPVVFERSIESSPYRKDRKTFYYEQAADTVIKNYGADKGYCLVPGAGKGRLAYELAKRCDMRIIGVEKDARKVAVARRLLRGAGLYGKRIVIHHISEDNLPYQKYFANLIVSEETLRTGSLSRTAAEMLRVLRPGGKVVLGFAKGDFDKGKFEKWSGGCFTNWKLQRDKKNVWAFSARRKLKNTGRWTHLYANCSNTNCSMDENMSNDMEVQWFGKPGPRNMIDRHHRTMSPLYKDGRLFVYGNNRIIAVDAYNGAVLWELEVPGSLRLGVMNDCGNMCVTDKYVFIATKDECWCIDVATGGRAIIFKTPQLVDGQKSYWGYIATVDGQLFGSGQKEAASFASLGFRNVTIGQIEGDFRLKSISDRLFSINLRTGKELWTYRRGAILNSSIVIGKGRIFFVESRNPEIKDDADGRVRLDSFLGHKAFLVGLDTKTANKIFEKPLELPFQHIMFSCCADNTVLLTGSYNIEKSVHYGLYAFDGEDGRLKWTNSFKGSKAGGVHGEQWQHPSIVKNKIYLMPHILDLKTGQIQEQAFHRQGGGCGTITASATHLFYRSQNPRSYDIEKDKNVKLTNITRPGCWINIISGGGLVLIPESSSGCTCPYSLQTSLALIGKTNKVEESTLSDLGN